MLGAGGVRCKPYSVSLEVVDGVIAAEEDVTKNKVSLIRSHEAQHATLLTLVLHGDNIIVRVNLQPMFVHHEINAGKFVSVVAADLIHTRDMCVSVPLK